MLSRRCRPTRGFTLLEVVVSLVLIAAISTVSYTTFSALYERDDEYRATQIAAEYEAAVRAIAADGADSPTSAAANPLAAANSPTSALNAAQSAISADPAPTFIGISDGGDGDDLDDDGQVQMSWKNQVVCIDFGTPASASALVPATLSSGAC